MKVNNIIKFDLKNYLEKHLILMLYEKKCIRKFNLIYGVVQNREVPTNKYIPGYAMY